TKYAKAVLTFAVTAPLCGGLLTILKKESLVTDTCLWRLIWSPCIMVAIAASRVVARFQTAKKLLSYAVLTEGLTLAVTVALFLSEGYRPH
ncbi:MAG: hypothetical protein ACXVZX_01955, partial [Terriglobales bacterium]